MKETLNWIQSHFAEILTTLGIGGGSGLLGKKIVDKRQAARLKQIEENLSGHAKEISDIKKDLEYNDRRDLDLRSDIKDFKTVVNNRFNRMEEVQASRHNELLRHIIDIIK